MPQVSIVIPTYNHARYVGDAIESALTQTFNDFEVIVVDDGSTDATPAVLERYGERIVAVRQENAGLSAARNHGFALARGEQILFLDADDLIPPCKLAVQTTYLKEHPELGLTYSAWQHIDADGRHVVREVHPRREGAVLRALLLREFFPAVGSVLVRRRCIEEVGPFDPALRAAEDVDLWMRIARAGYRFGYQDDVLFSYRDTPGSMSRNLANQLHYELRRLDKFFAQRELQAGIAALRGTAEAAVYFEYAARWMAADEIGSAQHCFAAALAAGPDLVADEEWLIGWLSGSVVGWSADRQEAIVCALVEMLPGTATRRESLLRRALGRAHADAVFGAYETGGGVGGLDGDWRHVLPALIGEPRLLSNLGFWKAALSVLVGTARTGGGAR
jgi:glycosyltransferase involved in cell wall biosynthesis